MRTRLLAITAGILIFVQVAPVSAAFIDTNQTRYAEAFSVLHSRGIVRGFPDGTARPFVGLNRVEALKLILEAQPRFTERIRWYKAHLPRLPLFQDIEQSAWYAPYVETAFEAGLITGYPDRTFRPGNPVKAEEAIALLMRGYDVKSSGSASAAWYQKDVDAAAARNIVAHDEVMYVGETVNRGQFIDMVYRLDYVIQKKVASFPTQNGEIRRGAIVRKLNPIIIARGPVFTAGSSQFSISIPALGIDALPVSHPVDPATSKGLLAPLKYGVGHLFGYPGGGAKVMIYGHSSGYAWDVSQFTKIFRRVNELQTGDRVYVNYEGKQYVYQVTTQETVEPHDTRPFSGEGEELILFTCWPPDSAETRLLVHAEPVREVAQR